MSVVKKAVLSVVGNNIFSSGVITQVESVGQSFKKIQLTSEAFSKSEWKPGEKIQINVGNWNVRTYTPLDLVPDKGQLQLVAYLHGQGPGSTWAKTATVGQACQFIGPKPSIQITPQPTKLLIFGDETSLPLAATFQKYRDPNSFTEHLFEVSSMSQCEQMMENLALPKMSLFEKAKAGVPEELLRKLREQAAKPTLDLILLTGNAKSIQQVRTELRTLNFPPSKTKVKAYWAPGKTGID